MRAHVRTAIVLLLAAGLLFLFLRNTDLTDVAAEMGRARPDLLVLSVLVTGFTYVLRAARWQYLLAPIGRVGLGLALRTTVIGFAATALLPARAGELLRPYLLARKAGLSATATFATIIVERLLDTITVVLLFAAYLFVFDTGIAAADATTFRQIKLGGALAGGLCLVALILLFFLAGHPGTLNRLTLGIEKLLPASLAAKVSGLVRTFAEGLRTVRQPKRLAAALVFSLPLWLSIAAGIWLVTRAFHITMPFTGSFVIVALLVVGVAVPTPGAVGGFHYFYKLGATAFFAASPDRAVGAALVLHAVSFVPVAIAGLILMAQEGLSLSRLGTMSRTSGVEGAA
jgi:glycosyltransferase 2 family protein